MNESDTYPLVDESKATSAETKQSRRLSETATDRPRLVESKELLEVMVGSLRPQIIQVR